MKIPLTKHSLHISPLSLLLASLLCFQPLFASTSSPDLENQLAQHASPYLALHGNDPVHWQDWGESVVTQAKTGNRLIFISSGYFSCHWCHVMQRESYSDKAVADLLNQMAVPVKIDRELQPALDSWLIHFTEQTRGQAGWPLNVFLTPDGYPLIGMTYLPREQFMDVLTQLQQRWNQDQDFLKATALSAFKAMQPATQIHSGEQAQPGMDKTLARLLIQQALQVGDDTAGGFGDQNKFPMSPQLRSLMETQANYPDAELADFLRLTLDQMAQLGLRDHVGGGFFRYVVDPAWETPHFEKMLYDNAQLIDIYLRAAKILKNSYYQEVALDTLDFVLRDMRHPQGGYIASLSAVDDKDIEGGYYLWQTEELKSILSAEEFQAASTYWGAIGSPYLEAGHHLMQDSSVEETAKQLGLSNDRVLDLVKQSRSKLHKARLARKLPADTKVLSGWNGLLLSSLSHAAATVGNQRYQRAAEDLYLVLSTRFWDGDRLYRFIHQNKTGGRVSLEDYAYVSRGIADWASISSDPKAWQTARQIALAGLQRFHNDNGWQLSESLIIPYNARELVLPDQTMPSPSATLLGVLHDIATHYQDKQLKQQVLGYVDIDLAETVSAPLWYASHIRLINQVLLPAG